MKDTRQLRTSFGSFLLAVFVIPLVAVQGDGRDFAGFYGVADVQDLGEDVSLTLKLRVFNYSGVDLSDATLRLRGNLLVEESYGALTGVWITSGDSVRLQGTFVLPRHEYEQWEKGATPHLRIEFSDATRRAREQALELTAMLLDEGEE